MSEKWVPVVGYEGLYEVSDKGRVKALPRLVQHYTGAKLNRAGRVLRGCVTERNYVRVSLCHDGKTKSVHVHTLVAAAFKGPRPAGAVVRHLDGDSTNNNARNVEYGTSKQNAEDMVRHGRMVRGEAHGKAKLTDSAVKRMRALRGKRTYAQLSAMFGVSVSQVGNIVTNKQRKV